MNVVLVALLDDASLNCLLEEVSDLSLIHYEPKVK
jgi:hypothetical protein